MNFEQASRLRDDLLYLIGEENNNTEIIDVVIAPIDANDHSEWTRRYLRTDDNDFAIAPFRHKELGVDFIFSLNGTTHTDTGVFLYGNVFTEARKYGVDIDPQEYGVGGNSLVFVKNIFTTLVLNKPVLLCFSKCRHFTNGVGKYRGYEQAFMSNKTNNL